MPLRLKPVARSLSVRAEFFGLELEDWGLVIAWAILMRLIGALAVVVFALAVFLPQASAARGRASIREERTLSSLAARIPISEIRDDLIVRRDGSFCAGWECNGIATQFADPERLESVSSN